jgi:hypothetical protein
MGWCTFPKSYSSSAFSKGGRHNECITYTQSLVHPLVGFADSLITISFLGISLYYNGAFTLDDVKSMLIENLGGIILSGTPMLNNG